MSVGRSLIRWGNLFEPFAPRRQPSAFQLTCPPPKGVDDMLTYRTYILAAIAAALTATAIARLHRNDADLPTPNLQAERSQQGSGDTNAQAAYLPDLFVDEERAARIEPLPPQF